MATEKQKEAAGENIKKAQAKWRAMSPREHARAQPTPAQRRARTENIRKAQEARRRYGS